jgi:Domain of unknown function (DUF4276)
LRLHILVEGPSEAAFLRGWFPRFLPRHGFNVIQHRGKGRLPGEPSSRPDPRREGLLDRLPAKLRAYGRALDPATDRILVFLDLDADDCGELKERLLRVLDACDPRPVVLFRIAIEETEAFYLGDPQAIKKAFPQANLRKLKSYAQDSVCGTWEVFREVVRARSEDKVRWAERMAPHLGIEWRGRGANPSPSFQQFCKGLRKLAGEPID